ncbi:MAG TPA: hypothetical protein VFW11_09955 [Cyclobacteriaceae bacterium]|nr:hypothetical protein [Cyclobacteriaceae bacterium]
MYAHSDIIDIRGRVGSKGVRLADPSSLRNFKTVVGIDIIYKYRVRFVINLGERIHRAKTHSHTAMISHEAEVNREIAIWDKDRQQVQRMH